MKKCRKCSVLKTIDEYYFNKSKGKYDNMCKSCHREYRKKHYNLNRQYYIDKKNKNRKRYFEENKLIVFDALSKGCADCGESNILVLQFDHLRDKKYNVATMIKSYPPSSIRQEISKCEVVCANCHIIRTACRSENWWKFDFINKCPCSLTE